MKFKRANENFNIMKDIYSSTNLSPLQELTETNLNRVVRGHDKNGYAMISASRQALFDENGNRLTGQSLIDENNKRTRALKDDLKSNNFSFVPVYGGYKESEESEPTLEKSFIVFPETADNNLHEFNDFEKTILELGNKYDQETVLIKRPNENPAYYDYGTGKFDAPFTSVSINDTTKKFFTALRKYNSNKEGSPKRFTYEEYYLNPNPETYGEAHKRHLGGERFHYGSE